MSNLFCCVANDKGGPAKSLMAAELRERIERLGGDPWHFVEVEQRPWFSQSLYEWPDSANTFKAIPLLRVDLSTDRTELSLEPLNELFEYLPQRGESSRILVDFGASAFQSALIWFDERKALSKFKEADFKFIFFVPTIARDPDCISWINDYVPTLRSLGRVVIVLNHLKGGDFSGIDERIRLEVPFIQLPFTGAPLSDELCVGRRRLTFNQVAKGPSSRRARIDAEYCERQLSDQFDRVIKPILFPETLSP